MTDDTAAIQAAIDYCLSNGRAAYFPTGTYIITSAIVLDNVASPSSITIIGENGIDAVSAANAAKTVIKGNGCNCFELTATYPESSISISKLHFTATVETGYLLSLDLSSGRQLKQVYIDEVSFKDVGGLLYADSTVSVNLPYVYISRAYGYSTDKIAYFGANVGSTICKIQNSLFHGTANYGIHFAKGGELTITDTWFESCYPSPIYKPTANQLYLSCHNTYWEMSAAVGDPTRTAWNLGSNSYITLSGRIHFAFLQDAPSTVGVSSSIANYSSTMVEIISDFGVIETPDTIKLHKDFQHVAFVPTTYGASGENAGSDLMNATIGGSSVTTIDYGSSMPFDIQQQYAPRTAGGTLVRSTINDQSTYAEDRLLCAAFVYQASSPDCGFNVSYRKFTIDSVDKTFTNAYQFPTDTTQSFFCIAATPLVAGAVPQNAQFSIVNAAWNSLANVFTSLTGVLSTMLPFKNRTKTKSITITTGTNQDFIFTGKHQDSYKVSARFLVNNGGKGQYLVESQGLVQNGSKDVNITNQITDVNVVFTDNSNVVHTNFFAFNVANNTGSDITVRLDLKY